MMLALAEQNVLNATGPQAAHIEWIWWLIFWITLGAYVLTLAALGFALLKQHKMTGAESEIGRNRLTVYVGASTAATVVLLLVMLVASVLAGRSTSELSTANAIKIKLTGNQWWWDVEYEHPDPSQIVRTANEIHIPVGRPVMFDLRSNDVIHSFWIPNLHGKRDLIPGEATTLWLRADKPGAYRGQCAEFCGLQHANMVLFVIAEPQDKFDSWYANQLKPANEPKTDEQKHGQQVFLGGTCVMCHTIRGTQAAGRIGPDLTHVKTRAMIAAGTVENVRGNLGGWVLNPHSVKPGVRMPANSFNTQDLNSLLGYLESLE